jgi:hypothetical protein
VEAQLSPQFAAQLVARWLKLKDNPTHREQLGSARVSAIDFKNLRLTKVLSGAAVHPPQRECVGRWQE